MPRILIVDDRAMNREFLSSLLGLSGHEVNEAGDGREALAAVARQAPDLIITDLMMPGMDGLQLTRALRASAVTASIPIIFYTATYRFQEARELAQSCGVKVVLPKPSEPRAILNAVSSVLHLDSTAATSWSPAAGDVALSRIDGLHELLRAAIEVPGEFAPDAGNHVVAVHSLSLRLAAMLELDLALAAEHESQPMLDQFCRAAQQVIGARIVGVLTLNGANFERREVSASGLRPIQIADLAGLALDHGLLAEVARERQLRHRRLDNFPGASGLPASHPPIEHLLVVPLAAADGIRGIVYFGDKRDKSSFSEEDLQFASSLAAQLSLAYGNLMLLRDVQQHAGQLRLESEKRSRVAAALSESEARFRQVLENLPEAVFLIDPATHRMLYVSPAYEGIWGRERGTLYTDAASWLDPVHPADRDAVTAQWESSKRGSMLNARFRIIRLDGSLRWISLHGVPVQVDGRLHRIVAIAEDVTRDQRAAEVLRESEMRFRQLAENIRSVFFLVDLVGDRTLYVSPSYERIWGSSCASLYADPRSWLNAVHPEDRARVTASDTPEQRELGFEHEYRVVRANGSMRWVWVRGFPIRNEFGRVHRLAAIAEDITDRRAAQEAIAASEARYRQLFDSSPLPMWVYDRDSLRFLAVNQAAIEHYGYSRDEFLSMGIRDLRPREDLARLEADLLHEPEGIKHSGIWCHRRRDGSLIDVEISSHGIEFADRKARLVLANDVSERLRQEQRIARLTRIREVIGGINSAMLRIRDRPGLLKEACRVAGTAGVFPISWIAAPNFQDQQIGILAWHAEPPEAFNAIRSLIQETPFEQAPSTIVTRSREPLIFSDFASSDASRMQSRLYALGYRSGAAFPLMVGGSASATLVLLAAEPGVFDAEEISLLTWLAADLSFALESIENSARLDHFAYYDALTGLANAHLFQDRLAQFTHAATGQGDKVALVFIDLEGFTQINEAYGREVGDRLLKQVSARLSEHLVEPYAASRVGSDTFAFASPREPETLATRLRETVLDVFQLPFQCGGLQIKLAAQAGIAIYPDDAADAALLWSNAETALMLAKASGDRYVYYSNELNSSIAARRQLLEELRVTVDGAQFELHYQPRIDLISGELVGAEALIRWRHPQHGLLLPSEFIALAEESGLIVPIGAWVIRSVCAQQKSWMVAGIRSVPIAVNLAAAQFEKGDLLRTIQSALEEHALPPYWLDCELTESAVMKDPGQAAATLKALRKLGVGLALDDFGTGFSSLAHLKRFPFDSVKIDRSFVTEITSNPEDAAIATSIIAMAHTLKLKVVAEGVETEGQFNFLRSRACDEMQGHYFSEAVAANVFEEMLLTRRRMRLPLSLPDEQPTLLLVDDEPGIRSSLTRMLRPDGYRILNASGGQEGLDLLALHRVHVIISDQRMPAMSGTEFLSRVKDMYPDTVRIILSGYTDLAVVTDAVNRGSVYKFLTKPWDDETVREQIRDAFRRQQRGAHAL